MLKEEKAQGSIELLLLLGGVIFIATLIGVFIKSIPGQLSSDVNKFVEA